MLFLFFCIQVHSQNNVNLIGSNGLLNIEQEIESGAIESNESKEKISIYPNPATDHFLIQVKREVHTIEIYNIVGKLMKNYKVVALKKYSIEQLKNGIYLVRFLDINSKVISVNRLSKR